jgi:hypothetical protein
MAHNDPYPPRIMMVPLDRSRLSEAGFREERFAQSAWTLEVDAFDVRNASGTTTYSYRFERWVAPRRLR